MDLFFFPEVQPGDFTFNREESKHIIKVLRSKTGDELFITDGKGHLFAGKIDGDNPNKCSVKITSSKKMPKHRPYHVHLAVAPTKNMSRFEWFLEKATEIGIDEITPIKCDHSERLHINQQRLEKVMIAALKQSQQFWLPKLNPLQTLKELLRTDIKGQKFIAYVDMNNKTLLKSSYIPGKDSIVLIGPEGDFSEQEIELAISAGYLQISLGENRLRTETAAIVACHTINLLNQQ
jgi:16S rRNA (uracil1498-N3)-methyltransferase